jgi:hypothetical protein
MTYIFCIISKLDSYAELNLFPSTYLPSKEFSSQKPFLYEEYQAWSNDEYQKYPKEPEITQFVVNQINLAKSKVANDLFLINFKDAHLRELLSKCWSRVKVVSVNEKDRGAIKLFYCDFGFESVVMPKDLAICTFFPFNKLIPWITYECILNNDDFTSKLAVARSENDFVVFNYLNYCLDHSFLIQMLLRVDFSESLEKLNDMSKLNDISHITTINDFYVQKVDPISEKALINLHEEIQHEVASHNQLKKLESTEVCLNKLCVSIYHVSINTSKTIEQTNKDVSKFHDQSQDWDKSVANTSMNLKFRLKDFLKMNSIKFIKKKVKKFLNRGQIYYTGGQKFYSVGLIFLK